MPAAARRVGSQTCITQNFSRFVFKQPTTMREGVGIVLVVIGVALLVWAY